jgi:hypothetical protein
MLELHHALPRVSEQEALAILAEYYGVRGELRALPGERDGNF